MDASWTLGLDAILERYNGEDESTFSAEFIAAADFSAFRLDSPELDVTSNLITFTSLTEGGRIRADFNVRAQYEVFEDFFVALKLDSSFDSKPPTHDSDASKSDYTTGLSVGWSW
jgi:hypothetical protein